MAALQGKDAPAGAIWLDSLDVNKIEQGWSAPRAGCSAECHPITIHGVGFVHGIGTYSVSEMWIDLKGSATKFVSAVGVDDDAHGKGSVGFEVWADGKKLADTGVMRGGNEAEAALRRSPRREATAPAGERRRRRQRLRPRRLGRRNPGVGRRGPRHGRRASFPRGRPDRRSRMRIPRGRRCTARRSPAPRRAGRSCSSCPPAASRRWSSGPRISPPV